MFKKRLCNVSRVGWRTSDGITVDLRGNMVEITCFPDAKPARTVVTILSIYPNHNTEDDCPLLVANLEIAGVAVFHDPLDTGDPFWRIDVCDVDSGHLVRVSISAAEANEIWVDLSAEGIIVPDTANLYASLTMCQFAHWAHAHLRSIQRDPQSMAAYSASIGQIAKQVHLLRNKIALLEARHEQRVGPTERDHHSP